MKNIKTAIQLIAVQLGLSTSVALGADPVAGRRSHLHRAVSEKQLPVRTACAARLWPLLLWLLLTLPAVVQAQFNYYDNGDGTITITEYTGPGGAVAVPPTINGQPVTGIENFAFYAHSDVTSVTIPNSVTSIHYSAFDSCTSLSAITVDALNSVYSSEDGVLFNKSQTLLIQCPEGKAGSYTIPASVTSIGFPAFYNCTSLTSVTIPNSVTDIEYYAFYYCTSLTSVTIPNSVTSIGWFAFYSCSNLKNLTFLGNAPTVGSDVFGNIGAGATVYYYNGTTGWGPTYGGLPTVMLAVPAPQVGTGSAGVKPGGFGFTITGIVNQTIVVEASTYLTNWQTIWTNTLSGGSTNFVDSQWLNHPRRFYRLRSP